MLLLLLISLFSTRAVLSEDISSESREEISNHYIETVKELADDDNVVNRSRRSAKTEVEVCKYKKGEWSACHQMLLVSYTTYLLNDRELCCTKLGRVRGGGVSCLCAYLLSILVTNQS